MKRSLVPSFKWGYSQSKKLTSVRLVEHVLLMEKCCGCLLHNVVFSYFMLSTHRQPTIEVGFISSKFIPFVYILSKLGV